MNQLLQNGPLCIISLIIQYLTPTDRYSLSLVNKTCSQAVNSFWHTVLKIQVTNFCLPKSNIIDKKTFFAVMVKVTKYLKTLHINKTNELWDPELHFRYRLPANFDVILGQCTNLIDIVFSHPYANSQWIKTVSQLPNIANISWTNFNDSGKNILDDCLMKLKNLQSFTLRKSIIGCNSGMVFYPTIKKIHVEDCHYSYFMHLLNMIHQEPYPCSFPKSLVKKRLPNLKSLTLINVSTTRNCNIFCVKRLKWAAPYLTELDLRCYDGLRCRTKYNLNGIMRMRLTKLHFRGGSAAENRILFNALSKRLVFDQRQPLHLSLKTLCWDCSGTNETMFADILGRRVEFLDLEMFSSFQNLTQLICYGFGKVVPLSNFGRCFPSLEFLKIENWIEEVWIQSDIDFILINRMPKLLYATFGSNRLRIVRLDS